MLTGTCLVVWLIGAIALDSKYKLSECKLGRKELSNVDLHWIRNRRLDCDSVVKL